MAVAGARGLYGRFGFAARLAEPPGMYRDG